jgi:hypothetical protein
VTALWDEHELARALATCRWGEGGARCQPTSVSVYSPGSFMRAERCRFEGGAEDGVGVEAGATAEFDACTISLTATGKACLFSLVFGPRSSPAVHSAAFSTRHDGQAAEEAAEAAARAKVVAKGKRVTRHQLRQQ